MNNGAGGRTVAACMRHAGLGMGRNPVSRGGMLFARLMRDGGRGLEAEDVRIDIPLPP